MVDVFISYPRQGDVAVIGAVTRIRERLERLKLLLFVDVDNIDSGASFPRVIEENVRAAKAVLGLWTPYALTREWIRIECDIARQENKLFAGALEPIQQLPALFHFVNTIDLSGFDGVGEHSGWRKILGDIGRKIDRPGLSAFDQLQLLGDPDQLEEWAYNFPLDPLVEDALDLSIRQRRDAAYAAVRSKQEELRREAEVRRLQDDTRGKVHAATEHRSEASQAAIAFARAQESGDLEDLKGVEELFPNTLEAFEARRRRLKLERELDTWRAVDLRSASSLTKFIEERPDHPRADEAQLLLQKLTLVEEQEETARVSQDWKKIDRGEPLAVARLLAHCPPGSIRDLAEEQLAILLKPGREFKDSSFAPTMVVMPEGSYRFGSTEIELERFSDDVVCTTKIMAPGLAVAKYPVLRWQWKLFSDETGFEDDQWSRPPFVQGDEHPVVNVNWNDASQYVVWLSERLNRPYRLLNEVEWEYACRAGTDTPYSFGESITPEQANYGADLISGPRRKGIMGVGTKKSVTAPANGFGVCDMHGNVFEWVEDTYIGPFASRKDALQASLNANGANRVARGGAWCSEADNLRSAARLGLFGRTRSSMVGFRVARLLVTPSSSEQILDQVTSSE